MSQIEQRLLARRRITESGCWEYPGGLTVRGYAPISVGNKKKLRHRVSYEHFVGPIPEGLDLDHLCRNRACFNPAHLEPVTRSENIRRGIGPQVIREKYLREVTHCRWGHPFDDANTEWRTTGGRRCRICRAAHSRTSEVKRTAARRAKIEAAIARGDRRAPLSRDAILLIRVRALTGENQRVIAQEFGISSVTVSAIKNRTYAGV